MQLSGPRIGPAYGRSWVVLRTSGFAIGFEHRITSPRFRSNDNPTCTINSTYID